MLTTKALKPLLVKDVQTNKAHDQIAAALNPVLATPILDGVQLIAQKIGANGKLVASHNLGRAATSWHVGASNAPTSVPYAVPADQKAPTQAVVLTFATGAGATITLWVY